MLELSKKQKIILLADDDTVRIRQMRVMLEQHLGHEVVTSTTGKQSLERVLSSHAPYPDIVLLDLELPGMEGLQVARIIHAVDPLLPVIFYTDPGHEDELQRLMKTGAVEVLIRPLTIDRLHVSIERALSKKS